MLLPLLHRHEAHRRCCSLHCRRHSKCQRRRRACSLRTAFQQNLYQLFRSRHHCKLRRRARQLELPNRVVARQVLGKCMKQPRESRRATAPLLQSRRLSERALAMPRRMPNPLTIARVASAEPPPLPKPTKPSASTKPYAVPRPVRTTTRHTRRRRSRRSRSWPWSTDNALRMFRT